MMPTMTIMATAMMAMVMMMLIIVRRYPKFDHLAGDFPGVMLMAN